MANKFVLTAQVSLQAPTNTKQVLNQIQSQIGNVNVKLNLTGNSKQLNTVNNQLNAVNQNAKAASNSVSELGKTIGIAARRFGAISLATGTFLNLTRAIKNSIGDAIEFERQMVILAQTTEKSVRELGDLYKEVTRLATGLGVSSDGLLKTSIILAQAGLEARKAKAALEVLAKTQLAASFDDIGSTTEGAIAILAQFRKEAAGAGGDIAFLERSLEAINQVSKKYAVESSDLISVIRRSGGAFEAAGGSLNELLALFTSVRATTRESAETISTGLRTIFTRIQRVDTIRQLQELGIALQDAEGKFVGPFEAIKRISEGLSSLDPRDFKFAQIVEELGGFRQIGKVIPLIKQFALAQEALNTAQESSGSLSKDAETAQQSLANRITKVKEEFQALIREFVDSEGFRSVANGALEFARALIRIADAIQPLLPLIASLGAIQLGRGLASALGAFSGFTRRNTGGRIHAFATGGFVPGSGNRDTVPAMLTPGEFVIRKSSAQKIGASGLQRLNKGGIVNESAVGGIFLDPNKSGLQVRNLDVKNADGKSYTLYSSGLDTEKAGGNLSEKLKDSIKVSLGTSVNEIINSLFATLGIKNRGKINIPDNEKRAFTDKINPGAVGTLFEAVLTRIARATTGQLFDQGDTNQPFDFVSSSGMGPAIKKLFPFTPAVTQKYIDAKASYETGKPGDFASKVERQIKREQAVLSAPSVNFQKGQIYDSKQVKSILGIDPKKKKTEKELLKKLAELGYNPTTSQANAGSPVLYQFANGGTPKGTDTVPAMLTPGEFVINKASAQRIGYSELNRINKTGDVKGYANGGPVAVGFANGGTVDNSFARSTGARVQSIVDAEEIKRAFIDSFDHFDLSSDAPSFTSMDAFSEPIKEMKDLVKVYDQHLKTLDKKDPAYQKTLDLRNRYASGVAMGAALPETKTSAGGTFFDFSQQGTTEQIVRHEVAHRIDQEIAKMAGFQGGQGGGAPLASTVSGTFQNEIAKKLKPLLEAQLRSAGLEEKYIQYRLKEQEIFADLLANTTPEVRRILASTTDSAKGMAQLANVITAAKGNVAGLSTLTAADLSTTPNQKAATTAQAQANTKSNITSNPPNPPKLYQIGPVPQRQSSNQYSAFFPQKQTQAATTAPAPTPENKNVSANILQSAQSFVFLASSVSTLATQFSSATDAQKRATTETIAFASVLTGAIGTVGSFALSLASTKGGQAVGSLLAPVLAPLVPLLAPLAPALIAIGAIAVVFGGLYIYSKNLSKALSEEAKKRADTISEEIQQGKRSVAARDKFIEEEARAAKAGYDSYYFSVSAIGEEVAARKRSAAAYIDGIVALRNFDDKLKAIDADKSLKPLEASLKRLSAGIELSAETRKVSQTSSEEFSKIVGQQVGGSGTVAQARTKLEKNPELKKTFEQFERAAKSNQETLKNRISETVSSLQASLEESLRLTKFSTAGNAVEDFAKQAIAYSQALEAGKNAITNDARSLAKSIVLTGGSAEEAAKALTDAEMKVRAFEESAKKQIIAAQKAQQSANLLSEAMQKSAQSSFIVARLSEFLSNVASKTEAFGQILERTGNVINGEFASFSLPEVRGLDDFTKVVNLGKFGKEVDVLASNFGKFGQQAADQIKAVAGVFKESRNLLGRQFIAIAKEGEYSAGAEAKDAIDSLLAPLKGLGPAVEPLIQRSKAELLKAASADSESGSTVTQAELENSLSSLKDFTQQYSELFASLNATQSGLVSQYSDYTKALAESFQKDIDFRERAVSIQSRFSERMSQALDKPLTAAQKEAFRNQARNTRLGATGISTAGGIGGIGQQLKDFQDKLRKNAEATEKAKKAQDPTLLQKLASEERNLTIKAREATKALESFADQSDRASDVLADIEKERSKRELGMKTITDFVVGSQEERGSIMKNFAGLQIAGQTGTLQGFDAETRKSVFGLLEQLGSVDKRFEEFKKNLVISDAMQMGLDPRLAQMLANGTPKEQQLQQELISITQQETIATRVLAGVNAQNTAALSASTIAIAQLTSEFKQNAQKTVEVAARDFNARQGAQESNAATLKAQDVEAQKRADAEKEAAQAKLQSERAQVEQKFIQEMNALVSRVSLLREAQQKASGGIVYASNGTYVMKSKGTDTVPAMLTPGEFVINKGSVDKYGASMMNAINTGTYMADGGLTEEDKKIKKRLLENAQSLRNEPRAKREKEATDAVLRSARYNTIQNPGDIISWEDQKLNSEDIVSQARSMKGMGGGYKPQLNQKLKLQSLQGQIAEEKQKQKIAEASYQKSIGGMASADLEKLFGYGQFAPEKQRSTLNYTRSRPVGEKRFTLPNPIDKARQDKVRQNQMRLQGMSDFGYQGINGVMGTLLGGLPQQQLSPQQARLNNYNRMRAQQGLPAPQMARPTMNMTGMPTQTAPQNVYNQAAAPRFNPVQTGSNFDGVISGFKDFSDKITNAANVLSGMTMNHTVTVDGMLQVNSAEVAEAVKQSVAQFVVQEVTKQLGGQNKGFSASGTSIGRK
jgi:hypothetical protein